jgi:flagellar biosynthesis protein FlhG
MDQAQSLREYMHRFNSQQQISTSSRVITITSGKGGVGKSNFTLNFALGLKAAGKKVVILDIDFSTANINILMGITPRYSLVDVLYRRKTIWDVIEKGSGGIEYICGGLEIKDLMSLDQQSLVFFWSQIQMLQSYADFILLDTGAGISKGLVDFILASDETILVTTPEPTSIADAYAVLKTVRQFTQDPLNFRLIVNRIQSYREGIEASRGLKNACRNFLKINLNTLGFIVEDSSVRQSVKQQTPYFMAFPKCDASKNIKEIVYAYLPEGEKTTPPKGLKGFFEKMMSLGKSS